MVFEARKVAKYRNDLRIKRHKLNKKIPKMDQEKCSMQEINIAKYSIDKEVDEESP